MMQNKILPEDLRTMDADALEAALRGMLAELPPDVLLILLREFEALLEDSAE